MTTAKETVVSRSPGVLRRAGGNVAMTMAINQSATTIAQWIGREGVTPSQMQAWALEGRQVIAALLSEATVENAGWARGLYGSAARQMDDQALWEIVRSLAALQPLHAALFDPSRTPEAAANWAWLLPQLRQARDWLAGR